MRVKSAAAAPHYSHVDTCTSAIPPHPGSREPICRLYLCSCILSSFDLYLYSYSSSLFAVFALRLIAASKPLRCTVLASIFRFNYIHH